MHEGIWVDMYVYMYVCIHVHLQCGRNTPVFQPGFGIGEVSSIGCVKARGLWVTVGVAGSNGPFAVDVHLREHSWELVLAANILQGLEAEPFRCWNPYDPSEARACS